MSTGKYLCARCHEWVAYACSLPEREAAIRRHQQTCPEIMVDQLLSELDAAFAPLTRYYEG